MKQAKKAAQDLGKQVLLQSNIENTAVQHDRYGSTGKTTTIVTPHSWRRAAPITKDIASNYCPAIDHARCQALAFERFSCGAGAAPMRHKTLMRDPGLSEAIQAVGGVSELARRIGISQPSVSNWDKVPAERVLAVEAQPASRACGCARISIASSTAEVDEIDLARAQEYALLSALLARAPDAALLARLARLGGDASPLGIAHVALGEAAARADGDARSSASISTSSSGSGAASCCPTPPTISPASSTSGRWRGCAMISRSSGSNGSKAITSRRITPRPCARSWRRSPAGASRRRKVRSAGCSRSTWRRGSAASSPISSAPRRRDFYRAVGALGRVFIEIETEAFALPG